MQDFLDEESTFEALEAFNTKLRNKLSALAGLSDSVREVEEMWNRADLLILFSREEAIKHGKRIPKQLSTSEADPRGDIQKIIMAYEFFRMESWRTLALVTSMLMTGAAMRFCFSDEELRRAENMIPDIGKNAFEEGSGLLVEMLDGKPLEFNTLLTASIIRILFDVGFIARDYRLRGYHVSADKEEEKSNLNRLKVDLRKILDKTENIQRELRAQS